MCFPYRPHDIYHLILSLGLDLDYLVIEEGFESILHHVRYVGMKVIGNRPLLFAYFGEI